MLNVQSRDLSNMYIYDIYIYQLGDTKNGLGIATPLDNRKLKHLAWTAVTSDATFSVSYAMGKVLKKW